MDIYSLTNLEISNKKPIKRIVIIFSINKIKMLNEKMRYKLKSSATPVSCVYLLTKYKNIPIVNPNRIYKNIKGQELKRLSSLLI